MAHAGPDRRRDLLVIAVPEQLATSRLAGMPPITGVLLFIATRIVRVHELRAVARFDRIELANAVNFRAQLRQAITAAPGGPPRAIVLDALGMSDVDYTGGRWRWVQRSMSSTQPASASRSHARAGTCVTSCVAPG